MSQGFYRVRISVNHGNRDMSNFISKAGLGIVGIGIPETMVMDYKPGEVVDKARVVRVMESMIAASDEERTNFKILSYEILDIKFIEPSP